MTRRTEHRYVVARLCALGLAVTAFFYNGCGFVSLLGTPTRHEQKVPAEYSLAERADQKILVLVYQPPWLNSQANLRYYLTKRINEALTKKVKIPPEYLVSYDELSKFRSTKSGFSLLSPAQVGAALNAHTVLFVNVDSYDLRRLAETDYYKGSLSTRSILYDTATGRQLWPQAERARNIRVGFEVDSRGQQVAIDRLAAAVAHCTLRYFYDCPVDTFKISEDQGDIHWENPG